MTTNEQRLHDLVTEQAAEWMVENRGGLDTDQRATFSAWLKASPLHVQEYLAIAALSRDLPAAAQPGKESIEELIAHARAGEDATIHMLRPTAALATGRPSPRRYGRALAAFASVVLLAIAVMTLGRSWWGTRTEIRDILVSRHLMTRHGEQQTYRLADQSVVRLNTDTALTIHFDTQERLVVLERGEAEFEVASDTRRHFRVGAGSAQVVALGTRFDVRVLAASTLVTVAQGHVRVGLGPSDAEAEYRDLGAGQQMRVAPNAWPAPALAVDVDRVMGWLRRKIRFDDEPLSQVTSELNRYVPTPFEITAVSLQELRISGVFATDDPQAFIAFLHSLPGVKVTATATRILVSQF